MRFMQNEQSDSTCCGKLKLTEIPKLTIISKKNLNSFGTMAEDNGWIKRYRAQVNFCHKFKNIHQLQPTSSILSPQFFARNLPFRLMLFKYQNRGLVCALFCAKVDSPNYSVNVEFQLSLITPSKRVKAGTGKISRIFRAGHNFPGLLLAEIFPGEEIVVDDAVTLGVLLWVDEPQGTGFKPPKEELRQELQIAENQVQSNAYAFLLDSGEFADVTFVTLDSSRVKAHKAILAARSKVFARMLNTDMAEARDNEIRIDDMGGDALKIMLRHIYSGQLEFPKGIKMDLKICQELANAGEKYDLKSLKEYAAMAMTEFVSLENGWELLSFVKLLQAEAATEALTSYCAGNVG